jgi:hypothetical protein
MVPEAPGTSDAGSQKKGPVAQISVSQPILPAPAAYPCYRLLPVRHSSASGVQASKIGFRQIPLARVTKRKPEIDKKSAAASVSRRGPKDHATPVPARAPGRDRATGKAEPPNSEQGSKHLRLYRSLTNHILPLYRKRRPLESQAFRSRKPFRAHEEREADGGFVAVKIDLNAEILTLIPVGLAIWFLLWVLWNWSREQRR